jgi:hypothetical protein
MTLPPLNRMARSIPLGAQITLTRNSPIRDRFHPQWKEGPRVWKQLAMSDSQAESMQPVFRGLDAITTENPHITAKSQS